MLLLHISDIHFRAPNCLNPDLDPDRPYRTLLLQDVRNRVSKHGHVHAILIGGDIAFSGVPAEYETAMVWIDELASAASCPRERIFVIPGNHDVDRRIILNMPAVRNARDAIMRADRDKLESELRTQISHEDTARALLMPFGPYNDFAKQFNCQIRLPDRLYWKQDLDLDAGVVLRIHGLTSTLLSGAVGGDDTRETLYLSPLQTVLDPEDNVVNLVLCHHPPDWLLDQDDVEDAICARASIHMFGHKHRQRITRERGYIRFGAGAVTPDRNELGWQPGYNLVDVQVAGSAQERSLRVEAHLLQWQSNPDQFRPLLTEEKDSAFRHSIRLPEFRAEGHTAASVVGTCADASDAAVSGDEVSDSSSDPSEAETVEGDPVTLTDINQDESVTSRHVVFLIHGIRTQAEWADRVAATFRSAPSITEAVPIRYGFLDVVRFWLPISLFRRRPIRRVERNIRDELSKKATVISAVAHSFGTYIIGRILESNPEIKIRKLILCGSILSRDFDWRRICDTQVSTDEDGQWCAVNDCGTKDRWPIIARLLTFDYGSSGRYGFGNNRIRDRFFDTDHSGFFVNTFVRNYWLPYIVAGEIRDGVVDRVRTPWFHSAVDLIRVPYIAIAVAILLVVAWALIPFGGPTPSGPAMHVAEAESIVTEFSSASHALRAARNLARARVIADALEIVRPAIEVMTNEADTLSVLAFYLSRGLPVDESWKEAASRDPDAGDTRLAVRLEARVVPVGTTARPAISANLDKDEYQSKEPIAIRIESGQQETLYLGVFAWAADNRVVRFYPRSERISVDGGSVLRFPLTGEPSIVAEPLKGNSADYEAFVVVATGNAAQDLVQIAELAGDGARETQIRAISAADFLASLALHVSDMTVILLPYRVYR